MYCIIAVMLTPYPFPQLGTLIGSFLHGFPLSCNPQEIFIFDIFGPLSNLLKLAIEFKNRRGYLGCKSTHVIELALLP